MKQTHRRFLTALLALFVVMPAGMVAFAAGAAGTGPDNALAPSSEWQSLAAGESRWYVFYYAGDSSQIQIELQIEPADSAGFVVWTPELIRLWEQGLSVEPIGRGSIDPHAGGKLVWSGNFDTEGAYYVVVEHSTSTAATSYYLLSVSGSGVSLSQPAPTPTVAPPTAQPKPTTPAKLTGKLVFQTTYGGPFYAIGVDGTGLQRIVAGIDPVWSPAGDQIAYSSWVDPRGVWVVNADGSNNHRVFDWSEALYPSWSPDGSQIIFTRQYGVIPTPHPARPSFPGSAAPLGFSTVAAAPPGGFGGFTIDRSTWNLGIIRLADEYFYEPQPASTINRAPDWSPDGTQIVFRAAQGLSVMSVDGKTSFALTDDAYDTTPVWSPDGTQVAFVHRQHDHWEIYVVDVNTGRQTRLTDTPLDSSGVPANSVSAAWSPTGQSLAFLTDRTGKWEIWVMNADRSNQRPLFDKELQGLKLQYAFAGERAIDWTK
jgi:hypothetical protein